MSNKLKSSRKPKESIWSVGSEFLHYLLDGMICVYMLLVIVVMPFYNQEGFLHIGTDKAIFFRRISVYGAWVIGPTLVLYLILQGIERVQVQRRNGKTVRLSIWQYCKGKMSVTDLFALLYGVSLILSYLCSDYKENTLWGAEGWYMGLLPQMVLVAIYFLVSKCWVKRSWMFLLFFPVSAVTFILGYLNRFGIFPIDMKAQNVQFISTIGNINWYCGYLVSVFFGGYYLLWQNNGMKRERKVNWKHLLLTGYVAVGFGTLVTQGSMSGLFTLVVMLIVTFCLSARDGERMLSFWQETLILSVMCLFTLFVRTVLHWEITYTDAAVELLTNSVFPVVGVVVCAALVAGLGYCHRKGRETVRIYGILAKVLAVGSVAVLVITAGMIVVNTLYPGCLGRLSEYSFFTFSPKWGSNRGATWKAGLMCFGEQNMLHKLVGVGPDGMDAFLYQNGSDALKQLVTERFGTASLTNAHNEWLTILVNEGILGCISFVGMMVSAIVRFLRYGVEEKSLTAQQGGKNATEKKDKAVAVRTVIGACGFCLLAYTVNNLFSFQQSMSAATIFVIMGIGEAYAREHALLAVYNEKMREEYHVR